MNSVLRFPEDFLWGTATSSHQIEGNNDNNDWWMWEQMPGHIADGSQSDLACDWWRRAEEDFDRARDMGQNAHRLSIEWSRIEPREGEWSDEAITRYRAMLVALRERGIEPMVTLHHFTTRLWLVEKRGWETEAVVPLFTRYVTKVVEELGDLVTLWCTINEPNVYAYEAYLEGTSPPGRQDLRLTFRVLRNMLLAHGEAYQAIHGLSRGAQVGIAHHMRLFDPAHGTSRLDRWTANVADYLFNEIVIKVLIEGVLAFPLSLRGTKVPSLLNSMDYFGLNYYTRDIMAFDLRRPGNLFSRRLHAAGVEMSDGGYGEVYPEGLYRLLKRVAVYEKPIYITENGLSDDDDDQRPRFLITHLASVHRAISEGVPVRGYFHWSLVDNFEWAEGWNLRFGLIELDPESQVRTMRRSGELYAEICKAGAITEDMVARYAPEVSIRNIFGKASASPKAKP